MICVLFGLYVFLSDIVGIARSMFILFFVVFHHCFSIVSMFAHLFGSSECSMRLRFLSFHIRNGHHDIFIVPTLPTTIQAISEMLYTGLKGTQSWGLVAQLPALRKLVAELPAGYGEYSSEL
jgi:hypothetical protein